MNSLAFKYRESLSSQKGTDISGALSNKNNYGGTQTVTKKKKRKYNTASKDL